MEEKTKKSIAVIGRDEFTLGFRLAGIQKIFNPENYAEKIQELVKRDDIGILVAEQRDVEELPNRVKNRVEESVDPVVVQLSEEGESMNLGEKIQKVIGVDITQ
ncbi:MAG: V-type ATP synthase subunit F [Candidatus Nanohaloarchaea archaeon]